MDNVTSQLQANFKKGMTLDQYLTDMKTKQTGNQADIKQEEDLYETSRFVSHSLSKKLITYEIRQSDEDNYQQSLQDSNRDYNRAYNNDVEFMILGKNRNDLQRKSNKNIINMKADFQESTMSNSKGFRVRKHSNSPYNYMKKDYSPPSVNKNMARSLYNNGWKVQKDGTPKTIAPSGATLYGSFLKGIKQGTNEKHFKKKNNRDLQHLIKYQKDMSSKYSGFNKTGFSIEGVTDRLYERKNKIIK